MPLLPGERLVVGSAPDMEECGRERVPQEIVVSDGCVLDERCLDLVDEVGLDCFGAPPQG